MTSKDRILIITADNHVPDNLDKALKKLDLDSHIYAVDAQETKQIKKQQPTLAVITMEKWADLECEQIKSLTAELHKLAVNTLILARDAATTPRQPADTKTESQFVVHGNSQESPEMLEGRLSTLIELQPELKRVYSEIKQLKLVNTPLNNQFLQVDEEMKVASRLQRDFLPRSMPEIEGINFSAIWRPASWVSGDIYDIARLDEQHIGFYIADAVGHGMPAALLTIFIKRAVITKRIEGNTYSLIDPGFVLAKLNDDIVEQDLSSFQFVTACYGILDIKTLELQIANAGHPMPMRIAMDGTATELDASGSLLGVFPDQKYESKTFQLTPGDKLLIYSDGIEEAFINEGPDAPLKFRKEFGDLSRYNLETMCNKLVSIIDREEGSLHPRDDVTIVGIEIAKEFQTP